ncbi:MAG: hypothetical protein ABI867_09995 [Kofleriaceae bacterium]
MRSLLLVLGVLASACGTYNFNRSALVPRATPRLDSGQSMRGRGQLDVGASSLAHFGDPGVGDPNAGIEIPGTQIHGGLRGRVSDTFSVGLFYETGLDKGAKQLKDTQPPVEGGNVQGYGANVDVSIPTGDPKFRVGLGAEVVLWSVPYVEFLTCAAGEECFPFQIQDRGRDQVGTFAASITPSYRIDESVTLFGGVTARQHPTLPQKGQETDPLFSEPEVESGPMNFIVSAGAEVAFADGGILASAVAYYDVSQTPAKYGPGVALMISLPFGKVDRSPPPMLYQPVPQPYPAPGPQPYPMPQPQPQPYPYPPPQ